MLGGKNFRKNSAGEGQDILILAEVVVLEGVFLTGVAGGRSRILERI